jgi:DNA-binding NtrC family response regulator
MYRKGEGAAGRQKRVSILCIDNHASSNYACFLLMRSGYNVTYASFLSDALNLIQGSTYDLYVVNDELARGPHTDLFAEVRKAVDATPIVFYSTVVYPFSLRSGDQSGSSPETPVPLTEIAIAVARAIAESPTEPIASTRAA